SFWIKKDLTWTPVELSALAVWFSLPWTMKMVFGELADTVPLFGSQRRAYVFVGASLIAVSFVLLAGAAGGWITAMAPDRLYVAMALSSIDYSQEIIFVVSMAVVIWMLDRVTHEVDHATRMRVVYAAIIIFAFRATPSVGEGYRWFTIDVLAFDEAFYGTLQQLGAVVAIAGAWLLSDLITRRSVPQVLLWLTVLGTVLALPTLILVFELH